MKDTGLRRRGEQGEEDRRTERGNRGGDERGGEGGLNGVEGWRGGDVGCPPSSRPKLYLGLQTDGSAPERADKTQRARFRSSTEHINTYP